MAIREIEIYGILAPVGGRPGLVGVGERLFPGTALDPAERDAQSFFMLFQKKVIYTDEAKT